MADDTVDLGGITRQPRRASPRAILAIVGFSVFVAADDLTVVTTMLRPIINDLGLVLPDGLDDAAWIVNVYIIAFVAVMPIAGRISDVIGRRATFMGAYALFLVGTIAIPLTNSLGPFLTARVFTALGGGAMVPVALAVVGDVYPENRRARALGTLGAIETMGWVWGPLYGAMLVRFLDWRWQFWLNIPFAVAGMALVWWALADHDVERRHTTVDWIGAGALTTALVSVNLALLGNAEIQSVTGLEELTGGSGFNFRWFFILAAVATAVLVWQQRRATAPLIDRSLFAGRNLQVALAVNFVVGAVLIIAMVDVPIFVNAVEVDIERSAVIAGWVLSAMTATMALTSYIGGRVTERTWYRPPVLIGLAATVLAFIVMGLTWSPSTSTWFLALQLALLGAGLGLVIAPTTSAVVDATAAADRGAAAGMVMVVRLIGLSVGLSALTAWGLARFNALRDELVLPSITDPDFNTALQTASAQLTSDALAETFLASAAVAAVGLALGVTMRRTSSTSASEKGQEMDLQTSTSLPAPNQRTLTWAIGAMAIALVGAFALLAIMWGRLSSTQDDLAATQAALTTTTDDLERVEGGAALFASQVQSFQTALLELEPTVSAGLADALVGLDEFSTSTIEFNVPINETVVIETEIVIEQTVEVPIDETIKIDQTIETTIEIDTPLGFSVPVDVTVPVQVDVPIKLDLSIPVNETVPVRAEVPVDLDVPIRIEIAETELAALAESLAEGLRSFEGILNGLGG